MFHLLWQRIVCVLGVSRAYSVRYIAGFEFLRCIRRFAKGERAFVSVDCVSIATEGQSTITKSENDEFTSHRR